MERDWKEDFDQDNGNYSHRCVICKEEFNGHKHRFVCKRCDTLKGWIPIEDRLPEIQERVIFINNCVPYPRNIRIGQYIGESFESCGNLFISGEHVIYWMPLPEPPKTK